METKEVNETKNLVEAINQVMAEVKGVEKSLNVGAGQNSYKGVADQDVKKVVGEAMQRAGLAIIPINIEPVLKIDRWESVENWNGKESIKQKQQVFTEVKTTYKLMHTSGQSIDVMGYGHGIDSQDKSAGKALTYALKYVLLYLFLVPTGKIDDADKEHSNDIEPPKAKQALTNDQFTKGLAAINAGTYKKAEMIKEFSLNKDQIEELEKIN